MWERLQSRKANVAWAALSVGDMARGIYSIAGHGKVRSIVFKVIKWEWITMKGF